jgi:hypothetical protein
MPGPPDPCPGPDFVDLDEVDRQVDALSQEDIRRAVDKMLHDHGYKRAADDRTTELAAHYKMTLEAERDILADES